MCACVWGVCAWSVCLGSSLFSGHNAISAKHMVHTHRAHHLDQLPASELQHANNETKIKSAKSDFNEQVLSSS